MTKSREPRTIPRDGAAHLTAGCEPAVFLEAK